MKKISFITVIMIVLLIGSTKIIKAEDLKTEFSIDTEMSLFDKNAKIIVYSFKDDDFPVQCVISCAEAYDEKGEASLSINYPSRFAMECTKTDDIKNLNTVKEKKVKKILFNNSVVNLSKRILIWRYVTDNTIIYVASSSKPIRNSPFNAVSIISKY